jgi:catechol 2,3-dioxygenase-like lactoylglutathione lyase family enzyme
MFPRVTAITLGVSDLARSRKFYCEGLGFRASSSSHEHITFIDNGGGLVLALYGYEALAADAKLPIARAGFGGITLAWNVESRAQVDAALALAKKAGATIHKPAHEAFWGGYSGYILDPDDHPWEVAHNPHWTLAADGGVTLPE